MSLTGLALTTAAYVAITNRLRLLFPSRGEYLADWMLMAAQLISIALGTYANYKLHQTFVWPKSAAQAQPARTTRGARCHQLGQEPCRT